MENFEFIYALNRAVNVFNNFIDAHITRDTDVNRSQYVALMLIDRFPSITKSALARKLSYSHVTAGRLVEVLIEKQYVSMEPDRQNPHAACLYATRKGTTLVMQVKAIFNEQAAPIFTNIGSDVDFKLITSQLTVFADKVTLVK